MRKKFSNDDIIVNGIAGTEVILFGINVPSSKKNGLLGFKIEKKLDSGWLQLTDGRKFNDSDKSLVQAFMWSDYVVDPGLNYEYRFYAVYGNVDSQTLSKKLTVKITTEDPDDGTDGVFFNRGVAGSQAYTRKFSDYMKYYKTDATEQDPEKIKFKRYLKPEDVPKKEAYKWLSRGLEEALLKFISKAKDDKYAIRASLYELSHKPSADAFVDALERGVDVKILHHARTDLARDVVSDKKASITVTNYKTEDLKAKDVESIEKPLAGKTVLEHRVPDDISETAMVTLGSRGIKDSKYLDAFRTIFLPRTKPAISHNKFIILLKNDIPIEVWTGSTNITYGGIYGQSNVGQIIRNEDIAGQYFEYWKQISQDPSSSNMRDWLEENNPNLKVDSSSTEDQDDFPKDFVGAIFSPRQDYGIMDWYADKLNKAKNSAFLTSAFSIDDRFANVFYKDSEHADNDSFLRYLIVESPTAQYIEPHMEDIQKINQNRVAWGDKLDDRPGLEHNEELVESLTGLNSHVNYLHTKYMILDPLTDDPILISGSANFSQSSTKLNDENMLILRGNTRVADIYVTEFMRLFNHFKTRNDSNAMSDAEFSKHETLDSTDSWSKTYFKKDSQDYRERLLFSNEES